MIRSKDVHHLGILPVGNVIVHSVFAVDATLDGVSVQRVSSDGS